MYEITTKIMAMLFCSALPLLANYNIASSRLGGFSIDPKLWSLLLLVILDLFPSRLYLEKHRYCGPSIWLYSKRP